MPDDFSEFQTATKPAKDDWAEFKPVSQRASSARQGPAAPTAQAPGATDPLVKRYNDLSRDRDLKTASIQHTLKVLPTLPEGDVKRKLEAVMTQNGKELMNIRREMEQNEQARLKHVLGSGGSVMRSATASETDVAKQEEAAKAKRLERMSSVDPDDPLNRLAHPSTLGEVGITELKNLLDPRTLGMILVPGGLEEAAPGLVSRIAASRGGRIAGGALAAQQGHQTVQQVAEDIKNKRFGAAVGHGVIGTGMTALGVAGAAGAGGHLKLAEREPSPTARAAISREAAQAARVQGERGALQRIGERAREERASREEAAKSLPQLVRARPAKLPAKQTPAPPGINLAEGVNDFDQWLEAIQQKHGVTPKEVEKTPLQVGGNIDVGKTPIKRGPGSPIKRGPAQRTTLAPGETASEAPPGEAPITFSQRLDRAEQSIKASMATPKKGRGGSTNLPQMAALGVIKLAKTGNNFAEWSKAMLDTLPEEDHQQFLDNVHMIYGVAVRRHQLLNAPAAPGSPEYTIGEEHAGRKEVQTSQVGGATPQVVRSGEPGRAADARGGRQGESGKGQAPTGEGQTKSQTAPEAQDEAVGSVLKALRSAKKLQPEVKAGYSAERAKRASRFGGELTTAAGEAGAKAARGKLAGELPQPDFEPLQVSQNDRDALYDRVSQFKKWDHLPFQKAAAHEALDKMLDKQHPRVPAPHEIDLLRQVFGQDFTDALLDKVGGRRYGPLELMAAWQRFSILSGAATLGKLTAAATSRLTLTPVEELEGAFFPRALKEKAPRQGFVNPQAELKAVMGFFHRVTEDDPGTLKDMWSKVTTGSHSLDKRYGTVYPNHPFFDFFGRVHSALKTPAQRAEFFRSLEKRSSAAMREGLDMRDPATQMRVSSEAYADSERAILMQNNFVVDAYTTMLRDLSKHGTRGRAAATAGRMAMPIIRVPTNYVAEGAEYAAGTLMAVAKVVQKRGIKNLSPAEADFVIRAMKKNGVGAGLFALGYFQPGGMKAEGYYTPGEKPKLGEKPHGSVTFMGYTIPNWALHNPAFELFQMGATMRKAMDQRKGKFEGVYRMGVGLGRTLPFVGEAQQIGRLTESSKSFQHVAGGITRNALEPLILQQVAQMRDKRKGQIGPRNFGEEMMVGTPGLRERVPMKAPRSRSTGGRGDPLAAYDRKLKRQLGP